MRLAYCCASLLALLAGSAGGRDTARLSLGEASRVGDAAQVKALIAAGANLNARDAQGRTPLLQAADAGRGSIVTLLLKAGADVDASDSNGLTPLIAAARLADEDLARSLLDAGADPGMRHRAFGTALDVAERGASQALVQLLRERGAHGSGHSVGDLVCVRPWDGDGFCGRVLEVAGPRFHLRVERLVGCEDGCAPRDCSAQRPLGGRNASALGPGDEFWVASACLTHTGLAH
jgi:Ankyrin repeats (3 copies)